MRTELLFTRPPSINNAYVNKRSGGRFKSPTHKRWLVEARQQVMTQPRHFHTEPVRVEYHIRPPQQLADLCNYEKLSSDMLVSMGVLEDDSLIHEALIRWDHDVEGVRAVIERL